MLTQVRFQGIKVLGDVATELRPFTVIVGPNGCGKSTLLDQIEMLCLGSEPRGSADLPCRMDQVLGASDSRSAVRPTLGHAGGSTWVGEQGARLRLVIQASFNTGGAHWEPSIVETWVDGTNTLLKKDAPRSRDLVDAALRQHFGWRCQRLRLVPDAIAAPSSVDVVRLNPSGSGLPTVLKDLAANDTEAFAALQEDLRVVVPSFGRFRFGKDPVRDQRGEVLGSGVSLLMERRGGGLVPLVNVSDGTRVAMALLTAIHNSDLPSLVLMDDIDHGLHLSAQYEVIAAIRRVMARRPELQVICTTHSPVLLDSFSPDEVRVMALGPDGLARIQPLSAHPPVDAYRSGFSSGELWANLGEDWVAHG